MFLPEGKSVTRRHGFNRAQPTFESHFEAVCEAGVVERKQLSSEFRHTGPHDRGILLCCAARQMQRQKRQWSGLHETLPCGVAVVLRGFYRGHKRAMPGVPLFCGNAG